MGRRTGVAAVVAVSGLLVGACGGGSTSSTTYAPLRLDTGVQTLVATTTGEGDATLPVIQDLVGGKPLRYLRGGVLTVAGSCLGTGSLKVTLKPEGPALDVACSSSGGGGSDRFGPTRALPWPTKVSVSASSGSRWQVLVFDPTGAAGYSDSQ